MSSLADLHLILDQFPNDRSISYPLIKSLSIDELNDMYTHLRINIQNMITFGNYTNYYHATNLRDWVFREKTTRRDLGYSGTVTSFLSEFSPDVIGHILPFMTEEIQYGQSVPNFQLDYDIVNSYLRARLRREDPVSVLTDPSQTSLAQLPQDIINNILTHFPRYDTGNKIFRK